MRMENKLTKPDFFYIKQVGENYEIVPSFELTRRGTHEYMYCLKRIGVSTYALKAKPHLHGQFFTIDFVGGYKRIMTHNLKTTLLLLGFVIPTAQEYCNGTRIALQ